LIERQVQPTDAWSWLGFYSILLNTDILPLHRALTKLTHIRQRMSQVM